LEESLEAHEIDVVLSDKNLILGYDVVADNCWSSYLVMAAAS
jgi:hypothetical protein